VSELLLDTHAFLWWAVGDERLPVQYRERIGAGRGDVHVSAATAWEVRTKFRLGKLPHLAPDFVGQMHRVLATENLRPLPVTFADGDLAGSFAADHKDPFDRMLAAQALNHRLALVSNDPALDAFGVVRIW
jgi:PIN domain nuclease of toxin-antitoxin system